MLSRNLINHLEKALPFYLNCTGGHDEPGGSRVLGPSEPPGPAQTPANGQGGATTGAEEQSGGTIQGGVWGCAG